MPMTRDIEPNSYTNIESYCYAAVTSLVIAAFVYQGRRWYQEYAAKHNIKKEINKRFRFGNNGPQNEDDNNRRESLVGSGESNGPIDEEAKISGEDKPSS